MSGWRHEFEKGMMLKYGSNFCNYTYSHDGVITSGG
jgi:hypothetical protein